METKKFYERFEWMGNVLITGGAGFFGREFVKRLLFRKSDNKICVYSRDEAKHAAMRAEIADNTRVRYLIGDVRDLPRLTRAMRGIDTVIHAAALKRIEVGHYCPGEMALTNVIGSQNVVDAALECGVKRAVLLSTDKSCNPVSAYGHTKALAESIFLSAGPRFSAVRYGNVSGSTGSVIPTWQSILNESKKTGTAPAVNITDPDCTRYWMWCSDAVDLVVRAAYELPREILIPKTLPGYRLGDLAEAMGVKTIEQGLPAWEKKHEQMAIGQPTSEEVRRLSVDEIKIRLRNLVGVHMNCGQISPISRN